MKTIGELKSKIRRFTCTEEDTDKSFISDEELCCFIDMAQRKAATIISCLNKDYFTSCEEVDVDLGVESISLPSDIRASKIKAMYWVDGKSCCKLKRSNYECLECDKPGDPSSYTFMNKKSEGPKLYLNPTPCKPGMVRVIYERMPCDIESTTPEDTPFEMQEMCDYIFSYVKLKIYEKEKNPLASLAIGELNEAQRMMEECLCPQFGDCDEVELDKDWACYVEGNHYGIW